MPFYRLILLTILITQLPACINRKPVLDASAPNSISAAPNAIESNPDSSSTSVSPNTLSTLPPDSNMGPVSPEKKESGLEFPVVYSAADSLVLDLRSESIALHDSVVVLYDKIDLKANFVTMTFAKKRLRATGMPDSAGILRGKPVFTENGKSFDATEMEYNFETRRGLIKEAISNDGDTYLHGQVAKKEANDVLYIKNARFTTCSDKEHPHFDFATTKAMVIPDDKVVTGPAVLRISGVPTPLALPFGFFPSMEFRSSGILLPEYGEQGAFGFFLRNFGYYFGLSEYMDLSLTADLFTSLSFGARAELRYTQKYKHNGRLALKFSQFQTGDPEIEADFEQSRDFSVNWSHNQDIKAHPTFNFKADVNVQTSGFNRLNAGSVNAITQNQFNSSISITKRFRNSPVNLAASIRHFQNTSTGAVTFSLPEMVLNVSRITPFKRKIFLGKARWYEQIGLTYRLQSANQLNTLDSLLFLQPLQELNRVNSGMRHEINLNTNLTLAGYIFITPSVRYDERWHLWSLNRFINDQGQAVSDTVRGFHANRQMDVSVNVSTNVFSTLWLKIGRLKGIRHTMSPAIAFSYRPDLSEVKTGYFGSGGQLSSYSPGQIGLYGASPQGQSGLISLGINNRIEAKVAPSRRDSVTKDARLPIVEQFRLGMNYDLARDSLNLSNLSLSARTTLFKMINLNLNAAFDPYQFTLVNGQAQRINRFMVEQGILFRTTQVALAAGFTLRGQRKAKAQTPEEEQVLSTPNFYNYYIDFNIPYSLQVNYNISYSKPYDRSNVTHTIGLAGDINLTPRWKIAMNLNYDLASGQISTSSIDIFRDMHCWEMRISVIPFGFRQSYNFTINVKSPLLQALKLNRQRGWFNN